MQRMLRVASVNTTQETAKNGAPYIKMSFVPFNLREGVSIYSNQKERTRTIFGPHKDGDVEFKADGLWSDAINGHIKPGAIVEGEVLSFDTTPYKIGDRDCNKTTVVVFAGEDPIKVANSQLRGEASVIIGDVVTPPYKIAKAPVMVQGSHDELTDLP